MNAATPYATPVPGAPGYGQAALNATTAYNNTLARINQKRQATLKQYGYAGDVDPTTGVLSNVHVDPFNQYGGLQQMLRSGALAGQNADFAAEERGLHGGLAHKADSQLRYDFGQQSAQLGQDFGGAVGGFQDEQNQAAYSRDQALYEAAQQAARDAIDAQRFNPATPTDDATPTAPDAPAGPAKTGTPLPPQVRVAIKRSGAAVNDSILRQQVKRAALAAAAHNKKKKGGR